MCLGIPGLIIQITDIDNAVGVVDISGVKRSVNLGCILPEGDFSENGLSEGGLSVLIGRWVLVHVGFAMCLIDEEDAHKTLALLRELGDFAQALDKEQAS
jgi:hydrogenase expression/formation protein HypC